MPPAALAKKAPPIHAVHPGQKGGEHAQDGNETAEEHHLAAMAKKQVLPEFDLACAQADVAAVAQQQPIPERRPIQ